MIVNGIKVARIRIPKWLGPLYASAWPDSEKNTKLLLKLAQAAATRWQLAPSSAVLSTYGHMSFTVSRSEALIALRQLKEGSLHGADLHGWAQTEIEFQRALPNTPEEIEIAKRDWTR